MTDFYSALGISKTATQDEIKKAYRKLANTWHPDKEGGDEEKFKEIKEAYETLSNENARRQYDNPQKQTSRSQHSAMDEILRQMREQGHFEQIFDINVRTPIQEAMKGFTLNVQIDGKPDTVQIPAGIPSLARGQYKTAGGRKINVTVMVDAPGFVLTSVNEAQYSTMSNGTVNTGVLDTGTIVKRIELDALDLMLGTWVEVQDILGDKLSVRVPSGFNIDQKLKVKGKGYSNWDVRGEKAGERGDMFVVITPVFKPISKLDQAKVQALYEQTRTEASDDAKV